MGVTECSGTRWRWLKTTANIMWYVNYILMKLSLNSNNTRGRASFLGVGPPVTQGPPHYPPGEGLGNTPGSKDHVPGRLAGKWGMLFRACGLHLCPARCRVSHSILLAFPCPAHFTEKELRPGEGMNLCRSLRCGPQGPQCGETG